MMFPDWLLKRYSENSIVYYVNRMITLSFKQLFESVFSFRHTHVHKTDIGPKFWQIYVLNMF